MERGFEKMAYQLLERREGVEQRQLYNLDRPKRISKDEQNIPAFIIDKQRIEKERIQTYDDNRPQPSVYDNYQQSPQPEHKKDEEKWIVIVDMTVSSSMLQLEYIL